MGSSILPEITQQPATSVIAVLLFFIWVHLRSRGMGYTEVAISYDNVFVEKQYWRIVSASLSHISLIHLLFNVSSLWACGLAERVLGTVLYLEFTLLLLLFSMFIVLAVSYILVERGNERIRNQLALGYSCVVFGWMTILSQLNDSGGFNFFGFVIPLNLAPFGSLILTQLIVPRASLLGHLSGIIVGYLISFGFFSWIDGYSAFWLFTWFAIGLCASLKANSSFPVNFIQVHESSTTTTTTSRTMRNGVIVARRERPIEDV